MNIITNFQKFTTGPKLKYLSCQKYCMDEIQAFRNVNNAVIFIDLVIKFLFI